MTASQELLLEGSTAEGTNWRVWRITIPAGTTWTPDTKRGDRLVIGITPSSHTHTDKGTGHARTVRRAAGDAKFVKASKHAVSNTSDHTHITTIVEFCSNVEE